MVNFGPLTPKIMRLMFTYTLCRRCAFCVC